MSTAAKRAPSPYDIKWTRFIPRTHEPTVKQHVALMADWKRELLYGGAAGGGKSDWMLMAALQYVDQPGYSALIVRRTFPQLAQAGGLLPRAQEWLAGSGAVGSDTAVGLPTRWTFPSGATLAFGHMQHEKDRFSYQGGEYQFIGFDELGQFTESQYRYLFSRLRRLEGSTVPLRMRATSNPGSEWVRLRFLDEKHPDRAFVSAKLSDNPHIDQDEYRASLMHLPSWERQQLLDGDWNARAPGALFRREWFGIADEPPARPQARVRWWDLAATEQADGNDPDWSAGCLLSRAADRVVYVEDVQRFRASPGTVEARVAQTAAADGPGVDVWIEQEPGSSGKLAVAHFVRQLSGYAVRGQPSTGSKAERAKPFAAYAENGNVRLVRGPWVREFLDELERFPSDEHDDQVDAASGAFGKVALAGGFTWSDLYPQHEERVS